MEGENEENALRKKVLKVLEGEVTYQDIIIYELNKNVFASLWKQIDDVLIILIYNIHFISENVREKRAEIENLEYLPEVPGYIFLRTLADFLCSFWISNRN